MPAKSIKVTLKEHADALMAMPSVVGVAEGRLGDQPCVMVYVVEKTSQLMKRLPQTLESYAVVVEQSGTFQSLPK